MCARFRGRGQKREGAKEKRRCVFEAGCNDDECCRKAENEKKILFLWKGREKQFNMQCPVFIAQSSTVDTLGLFK